MNAMELILILKELPVLLKAFKCIVNYNNTKSIGEIIREYISYIQ